jgi:hypothetical protein
LSKPNPQCNVVESPDRNPAGPPDVVPGVTSSIKFSNETAACVQALALSTFNGRPTYAVQLFLKGSQPAVTGLVVADP